MCSLASVDYKNLKKTESDVTGTPAKVYIVRGRDTGMQNSYEVPVIVLFCNLDYKYAVGRAVFMITTSDFITPAVISTNSDSMCAYGGDSEIPAIPSAQVNQTIKVSYGKIFTKKLVSK